MNLPFLRTPLLVTLFLCFTALTIFSQDKDWRPVSAEDLASKTPVVEPDADAEAIFWEVRIDDSSESNLTQRHYVRVKIFTERGREKYSKFDVPFTKGLKIKDLEARVIKPDGTIVEIGKGDIFDREIIKAGGVKIKAKSFAVPNIEPGVIVEYRYKEVEQEAGAKGMRLTFQRDIPIRTLSYYYKPFQSKEPVYQSYNFSDTKFVKDKNGYFLATRTNVPSFKEEPRMPPEDTVRPWMMLTGSSINITSVSEFQINFSIKDPSSPKLYWPGVANDNGFLAKFMNKENKDIKAAAADITTGATSPDEKLRKLYDFCQNQIKNTSFDTTITDEEREKLPQTKSLNEVLKRKAASSPFIDMLFGALANSLGYDTRIAFTGDRSKMFFEPTMTNERLIHPAAIAVKVGDDFKYFNPGTPFLPYGMLIWYEEDSWALLVGEKDFYWRKTPLSDFSASEDKRTAKLRLSEDGTLEGDVRIETGGQTALDYRMENYDDSADKRLRNLKEEIKARLSTAEISDIAIENVTDASKPLVTTYRVRVPGYAQRTGKRIFIQPGFFEYGANPVFSSASRKYDIYFRYPWSQTDHVEIQLPAGYDLDNADSPANVEDPTKIGSDLIRMSIDKGANLLIYNRKFHFGGGGSYLFQSQAYSAVKNIFDLFHQADAHAISLKQKSDVGLEK
jgi:hypothetical protein